MAVAFRPASSFTERAGLFVSLTGSTNSGKTFSALRLARGIAGPDGKIAVLDTEGGRTLHLKKDFVFDANIMDPPFRPERFTEVSRDAEDAGYACLVIDSFSMEWVGLGGVLDWQAQELQRMAGDDTKKQERAKMASWIKPKGAHKAMVYALLQRRMPIVFSIRGEESVRPGEGGTIFKPICNKAFPFEVTVSFRLSSERKGHIDLSDAGSYKMEGAHQGIFRHGDQLTEEHGRQLAAWAAGGAVGSAVDELLLAEIIEAGDARAAAGTDALAHWWKELEPAERKLVGADRIAAWKASAAISTDAKEKREHARKHPLPVTFESQK